MKIFLRFLLLLCIFSKNLQASEALKIVSSINPVYQIVSEITQNKVDNILLIKPNFSEHNFHLKKSDIANIYNADLVFFIDRSLEKNLTKLLQNNTLKTKSYQLSGVENIDLLPSRTNKKIIDPHIWLSPKNAIIIAKFITKKICELDRKNCVFYNKNLEVLISKIDISSEKIKQNFANKSNKNFVFFHDGYQYFENYFGLKPQMILIAEGSDEIKVSSLRNFVDLVKTKQVSCLFGELYDEKNSAKKLAENYKINFVNLNLMGNFSKTETNSKQKKFFSSEEANRQENIVDTSKEKVFFGFEKIIEEISKQIILCIS